MLYVFDVANGVMLTFDVKLAFQSVTKLKEEIEKQYHIRAVHQVLLMSGGENLEPDAQISSYSTGTDENPVYLFNKLFFDASPVSSASSVATSIHDDTNCDLQNQVYDSSHMPSNYKALVIRTQIAHEFYEVARQQSRVCEHLVQEQHFQQQGWQAVVAHLEDVVCNCSSDAALLKKNFESYIANHQQHQDILNNLDEDKKILQQIPVLPVLRENPEESSTLFLEESTNSLEQSTEEMTLLQWISAERLNQLADHCSRGLKRYDNHAMGSLNQEIDNALGAANEPNLKEIKHVCERLYSLEQFMTQMKNLVRDQAEMVQKFKDDHDRIAQIKDEGNAADMCLSHHDWLVLMLQNHNSLREIWRRSVKAKEKLSSSIQRRLQRIVEVENNIVGVDGKIIMYNDCLIRLCKELEILRQVHHAPEIYASAVIEVVRRKSFSQAFITWSSNLVQEMQYLHNKELDRRQEFLNKFKGHFLNWLFPGFEDIPPSFATDEPPIFDDRLPNLKIDDLQRLQKQLPNLDFSFTLPNLNTTAVTFFTNDMSYMNESEETMNHYQTANDLTLMLDSTKSFLVNRKDSCLDNSSCNLSQIIQGFDESLKIRTRRICEERQGLRAVSEFELLDFEDVLKTREEKIASLQSLILEKEAESEKDHLLLLMKQKLNFEQESLRKLQSIHKQIEAKRKQARIYQDKLLKETKEVKLMESIFKNSLDKYEQKSKELYDEFNFI